VRATLVALLSLTVLLGACGGNEPSADNSGSQSADKPGVPIPQRSWTEPELRRLSGIRRDSDGVTYRLAAHPDCVAALILRSTSEVRTYKASGDVVITNPDQSAGVKVVGQSASCRRLFQQALANVR
jgi:hypothetical protein